MEWDIYIKPEFLALLPVLYSLAELLKKTKLRRWLIPYVLTAVSIATAVGYCLAMHGEITVPRFVTAAMQGVFLAFATIGTHQLIKQATVCRCAEKTVIENGENDGEGEDDNKPTDKEKPDNEKLN
ncbi:hypothetical protein FACS1894211_12500 [Clostridia bacterium]|nr:hypothetical protein FACS1894211_12500 [Clostridia bacterium]